MLEEGTFLPSVNIGGHLPLYMFLLQLRKFCKIIAVGKLCYCPAQSGQYGLLLALWLLRLAIDNNNTYGLAMVNGHYGSCNTRDTYNQEQRGTYHVTSRRYVAVSGPPREVASAPPSNSVTTARVLRSSHEIVY